MSTKFDQEVAKFNEEVRKWARERTPKELAKFHGMVALELLKRVIQKTPVDTGRTRGNWQTTVNFFNEFPVSRDDKSGASTISAGKAAISTAPPFSVIYLSNNVPWILVLENGLYPNPSKKEQLEAAGLLKAPKTRSKVKKYRASVRTKGGYSKQAPRGMVGISIEEVRTIFR